MISIYMSILAGFVGLLAALILARKVITQPAGNNEVTDIGKLIQEKALVLSVELGVDDFTASNGWLDRFQKRHNISCNNLNGEGADVNQDTVTDWCSRLQSMCEGYDLENIFNADETGLFYRALPKRS